MSIIATPSSVIRTIRIKNIKVESIKNEKKIKNKIENELIFLVSFLLFKRSSYPLRFSGSVHVHQIDLLDSRVQGTQERNTMLFDRVSDDLHVVLFIMQGFGFLIVFKKEILLGFFDK